MSHFAVMITNTDKEPVEAQLEPFDENIEDDSPYAEREYFVKNDKESVDQYLSRRINDRKEDIETYSPELTKFYSMVTWWKKSLEKYKSIQALKTVQEKLEALHEYEGGGIDKNGLYWVYNPHGEFDWWQEGGRWNNLLIKKNGKKCNSCKVNDLDLDAMLKTEKEERARLYDEETARAKKEERKPFFWGYDKTPTKEEYVNSTYIATYAILHEGEWTENNDTFTNEEWNQHFIDFINKLDSETEITIVDCHI